MSATGVNPAMHQLPWAAGLRADLAALSLVCSFSLVAGLWINASRSQPLPLVYASREARLSAAVARLPRPDVKGSGQEDIPAGPTREITLDEFQDFVTAHKGLVIDARAGSFYRPGHVPGAINVSRENFARDYAREQPRLAPQKDQSIALYCSEADCPDSKLVAEALSKLGYRRLLLYHEGWEEWLRAGLPQEGRP